MVLNGLARISDLAGATYLPNSRAIQLRRGDSRHEEAEFLLQSQVMQPTNTPARTDAPIKQPASRPETESGTSSGVFSGGLGHMVAGPYLSELMDAQAGAISVDRPTSVARESYLGGMKRDGTCGLNGLGDDRYLRTPTRMAENPRAISRSEPMRRGPDRCIVLLAEHERPSAALLVSLTRRGFEVLISFDHFDALARACLVQREADSWDKRGLLPKAGGLAMIISRHRGSEGAHSPMAIKALQQAILSHAPRCVCWEFDPDAPPQTVALRPVQTLHNGATTAKSTAHTHALPMQSIPSHMEVNKSVSQYGLLKTRESAGLENSALTSSPCIANQQPDGRMSKWETWPSDNRPQGQQDTHKSPITSDNLLLSARELAMLLAESPDNTVTKAEFPLRGGVRNIAVGATSPEQGPKRT